MKAALDGPMSDVQRELEGLRRDVRVLQSLEHMCLQVSETPTNIFV